MRAVDLVAGHFPHKVAVVRRLYLRDVSFRSICEDFALSVSSLRRFEARSDAHLRPEVEEYRRLLGELEAELRVYLRTARHDQTGPGRRSRSGLFSD